MMEMGSPCFLLNQFFKKKMNKIELEWLQHYVFFHLNENVVIKKMIAMSRGEEVIVRC